MHIAEWKIQLPSVTPLTLSHVSFGSSRSTVEQAAETSRDFFGSFKNLKAIGFSGVRRLDPASLAHIRSVPIEHLFLGICALDDSRYERCQYCPILRNERDPPAPPFLYALARYFGCKIKHLVLTSNTTSPEPVHQILSSHLSSNSYPHYLAQLETIRIVPPQMIMNRAEVPTASDLGDGDRVQFQLHRAGLCDVKLKWWKNTKAQNGTMVEWEPEEWNWN